MHRSTQLAGLVPVPFAILLPAVSPASLKSGAEHTVRLVLSR